MKTIKIGENEYTLEFTFEAAERNGLVQAMFELMSGAYFVKRGLSEKENEDASMVTAIVEGSSEMVADTPRICRIAFYAGLLENHKVSEADAKELMKQYMKENGLSFSKLFEELKKCMEDDGFFDLSGIKEMIQQMNSAAEKKAEEIKNQKAGKKSTSTK